jgi:hypothetical protein
VSAGYFIDADRRIYGPGGRTAWSLVGGAHHESVWSRAGDTGWRLAGSCFFDPQGRQTSYFVRAINGRRLIEGPDDNLPWGGA